jgi:outer membrane protein assembly factor BamA
MRYLLLACSLLAAVIGCGKKPRVHQPGEEWLAEIRLEGNTAIATGDLVPGLALKRNLDAGRGLDPYQLTVDRDRLRAAYVKAGFFEVTVTPRVDLVGGEQHVVFVIVEGQRSKLQVEIQGLPPEVSLAKARALIEAKDGAPFDYDAYDAAKEPMAALVGNAGYPHVALEPAVVVDKARGVAVARFAFEPGPRATFGPYEISGTDGDLAEAIEGRLAFRPGELYSATALADTQKALYDLGRFATVRVEPILTAGAVVPIRISVTLATRHEIKLGGGLGYDPINFEARLRVGGSYVNAAHPLWTFAADLRPAIAVEHDLENPLTKVRALVSASRMELFRPRIRGELELSADYLTVEAYTSKGPRFRAGVSAPLGVSWLQLRAGWLIEYLWFTNIEVLQPVESELRLDDNQRRGAYELSIAADLRDNSLYPRSGVYAQIRASVGTFLAGSDIDYRQITPELRGYLPLPAGIVLALRGRFGAIFGEVPVTERYFAGGANSHRGFPERRLSPGAATKDGAVVIGGAALVETGAELRIPLGKLGPVDFGTEVFLDGGDVTNLPKELDVLHLHWATGVGLTVKIKGVKARVDMGYRLNRTGPGEPQAGENFPFHIGVGDTY